MSAQDCMNSKSQILFLQQCRIFKNSNQIFLNFCLWKCICIKKKIKHFTPLVFKSRASHCKWEYCISSYSFRGNFSFLNLEIQRSQYIRPKVTVHKGAETIQGRKLFKGGNYMRKYGISYDISFESQEKSPPTIKEFLFPQSRIECAIRALLCELSRINFYRLLIESIRFIRNKNSWKLVKKNHHKVIVH